MPKFQSRLRRAVARIEENRFRRSHSDEPVELGFNPLQFEQFMEGE